MHEALRSWQLAGRVIFALRNVAYQARKVQRVWRACAARLREQRERIALRWERLERQELALELSKAVSAETIERVFRRGVEDRIY